MANKCKECGCNCRRCILSDHDVHLHVEIENLKQKLLERENHIVSMETNFLNEANKFPNGEVAALREELLTWQDKYGRIYDAHRRVQRVNQGLEDKLLKLVDVFETDKSTLTKDVATLSHKLAEANYTIKKLTEDNERYKNDVSLAIQFLQCKQSNFVAHKFDSLPQEVQVQVSSYMTNKKRPDEKKVVCEMKSIKVPIPTFPPTAMVYSIPKSPKQEKALQEPESPSVDIVSAAIMAKVLEERQRERAFIKHCDTCTCSKKLSIVYDNTHHTVGTQTQNDNDSVSATKNTPLGRSVRMINDPSVVTNNVLKNVQAYPNESLDNAHLNGNNVVKVQPNNFLTEGVESTPATDGNLKNNNSINVNSRSHVGVKSLTVNENQIKPNRKSPKLGVKVDHHYLCDKVSPSFEDKSESDCVSAKHSSSENLKGPRYCSMRLQSGTRNILLDNAHNNIPPVLYTRSHKIKRDDTAMAHHENVQALNTTKSFSSEDIKNLSIASDTSTQNQQRVADWIQSNLDNTEVGSSDNSQSDPPVSAGNPNNVDKIKYAEIEEHVKRFLFGESEFLKTVEIGKLKYQNYRDETIVQVDSSIQTRSNSHTETDI